MLCSNSAPDDSEGSSTITSSISRSVWPRMLSTAWRKNTGCGFSTGITTETSGVSAGILHGDDEKCLRDRPQPIELPDRGDSEPIMERIAVRREGDVGGKHEPIRQLRVR